MTLSLLRRTLVVTILLLVTSVQTSGHVLDQYLQASRIEPEPDRINVEIDLTAGTAIASSVFLAINTNHDGEISMAEGRAYAKEVLQDLDLALDGRRLTLGLVDCTYPTFDEMRAGTGPIRVRATAQVRGDPGRHQVSYRNRHRQELGAYLVNALAPGTRRIVIAQPRRDVLQQEILLEYSLAPAGPEGGRLWRWFLGLGLLAVCVLIRRATGPRGASAEKPS
jgi:hypothetical protein